MNIPRGNTVVFPGDKIQVIGNDQQLAAISTAIRNELRPEDNDIEKREMILRQIILSAKSPFIGKTLKESGIRDQYNCMVVGIDEGQTHVTLINPAHCLEEGDVLWVVAEKENIKRIQTTNE